VDRIVALHSRFNFQTANDSSVARTVIARSEATKQSILPLRGEMDCFAEPVFGAHSRDPLARNDGILISNSKDNLRR
jgi:hypothetical protein